MQYPKIYLVIDNCFAYKRWTRPADWAQLAADLGVFYVEASADTELDPLYMGEAYLRDWVQEVKEACNHAGVHVSTLYSGHGTYTTLGLTHSDARVRERFVQDWFKPMVDLSAQLEAGFGFYAHGFAEFVMQDAQIYAKYVRYLYENLTEINRYAKEKGCKFLSLEQMYAPYMVPWTLDGTAELMTSVAQASGKGFYFTEDVGHHCKRFLRPTRSSIEEAFSKRKEKGIWLGSNHAYAVYNEALRQGRLTDASVQEILRDVENNPRFFTQPQDNDVYEWLRQLGCYSSIVHLQQTDGNASAHLPFTAQNNAKGIITGERVLRALKQSYDSGRELPMERCDEIFITMECFFGTTSYPQDIIHDYKTTTQYWRKFIPQDGMRLDELVALLEGE